MLYTGYICIRRVFLGHATRKGPLCRMLSLISTFVARLYNLYLQIRGGNHIIFFIFLHEKICCGYSLEAPRRVAYNEYHNIYFWWRNMKYSSTFRLKKVPCYWCEGNIENKYRLRYLGRATITMTPRESAKKPNKIWKGCPLKPSTHKNTKLRVSVSLKLLICISVVCRAACPPPPPSPLYKFSDLIILVYWVQDKSCPYAVHTKEWKLEKRQAAHRLHTKTKHSNQFPPPQQGDYILYI